MKRILVATDDSADADRAVEYAERTTNDYEVELLNVNVIGGYGLADKVLMVLASTQQICLKEQLTSVSDELLTKTRNHVRTIGVATLESRTGDVAQTVIEIGREKKVDLIVAGKRGAGAISKLLLGSVYQKLVSLAPAPVTIGH